MPFLPKHKDKEKQDKKTMDNKIISIKNALANKLTRAFFAQIILFLTRFLAISFYFGNDAKKQVIQIDHLHKIDFRSTHRQEPSFIVSKNK